VAKVAGWRPWPIEILSATAVAASLLLWSLQLKRLGYSRGFVLAFVTVAGLSEPFISTAEKFRYEYLSLLLISAGLLLLAYGRIGFGFFVTALAFEIEPMAVLGLIPAAVLAYSVCADRRRVTQRMIAAVTAATAICLCLHPDVTHLGTLLRHAQSGQTQVRGGFFRAYFVQRYRHLPELAFFAVAGSIYWRRRHRIHLHYLGISAAVFTACSLIVPHGNSTYMVFLYPFLVGMALVAIRADRHPFWVAGLAVAYLLPQYTWLACTHRGFGYRAADIQQVSDAIDGASREIGLDPNQAKIYGEYSLWFAHPHFYRAASPGTLDYAGDADLFVCYEHPLPAKSMAANHMLYCPDLRRHFSLSLISTTLVRGNMLYLYTKRRN
jgi:hypothetical protein